MQIIFAPEKAAEILKKLLLDGREHQVISAWQLLFGCLEVLQTQFMLKRE